MINHLRTLLLNQPSSSSPPGNYPGEEFVPANYSPRTLIGSVATVYEMLFGTSPDRALLNFRLRELLGILHTSELAEFVLDLDPRITYWPPRNNSIFTTVDNGPTIINISGTKTLYLSGNSDPIVSSNRIYFSYIVTVIDGSHVTIQPTTFASPLVTDSYSITSGLSNLIQFPGSDEQFQFQSGVGSEWSVTWLARPDKTLVNVYQDLIAGMTIDVVNDLFGIQPSEPMVTFRNLWEQSPYPPYRIGGVTLALGYRLNSLVV